MAQEPEEEQVQEVKDKRRFNADGTPRENAESLPDEEKTTEKAEEPKAEEPAREAPMPPPNVYAMMEFVISMLAEQAWMLMGIRLAPGQKELVKDLVQAKVAIDTVAFMADKLHPHQSDEDRVAIRGIISDLQINYVRQSQG